LTTPQPYQIELPYLADLMSELLTQVAQSLNASTLSIGYAMDAPDAMALVAADGAVGERIDAGVICGIEEIGLFI